MSQRCRGTVHRGGRFQCTDNARFRLRWVTNPSGLPDQGTTWESWGCAQHVAQLIRYALGTEGSRGNVVVDDPAD